MIFSSIFLHAVTLSHVLHLDVLKSQIGLKLKVKTEIFLCMAIMQNTHCHPYIHSTTVLCDTTCHHTVYFSKCFYALLFHRHLSTFHGTHTVNAGFTRQSASWSCNLTSLLETDR